jgi:hypothetical protein
MILSKTPGPRRRTAPDLTAFRSRPSERGSFIVEAMVGGFIFACVTISLYAGFSMGFRSVRLTQEDVRANQIMLENMELVRVYDWSTLTSGTVVPTNAFTVYYAPPIGTNTMGSGAPYTVNVAITKPGLTESYSNTLRQVTVNVSWKSGGIARSRSMSTFISQNGIQTYKD